jgi:hypothetical protein
MKPYAPGLVLAASIAWASAATTIDPASPYAYGANLGWLNCAADTANGAVIGEYVCSGSIYAQNIGWISLGDASPADQIYYQNTGTDFGVNHDGLGNLRGYAYGANIGWVNFESQGAPRVDLRSGILSGHVYSANCGWISLSNAVAHVRTATIAPGQRDSNGFPIAWELLYFSQLGIDPNMDSDGDGMTNWQEYLAGTNPYDKAKWLAIRSFEVAPGGGSITVEWSTEPGRYYYLQQTKDLAGDLWADSGFGIIAPDGPTTRRTIIQPVGASRFFRVQALRPLMP